MTALEMAREIFPDKPDDWLDYVLWNRTAYPMSTNTHTRLQLMEFRDAIADCPDGQYLCEMCNKPIATGWVCEICDRSLKD